MPKQEQESDKFINGVFFAMQFLVIQFDLPSVAKDLAYNASITKEQALKLSKKTGYQVRRMNRFIREELT